MPPDPRVQRFIGLSLERIGALHEAAGRRPDAEAAYGNLRHPQHAGRPRARHRNIQRDLAIAYEKLGKVERATQGPGAGVANLRAALAQFERLAAADPVEGMRRAP